MFFQAALVSCHAAALGLFLNHGHRQSGLCQLLCHNQPQITAAQDHHRPFRQKAMQIHHLLHLSGGVNASGAGAADGQCPNGNLPAAGS